MENFIPLIFVWLAISILGQADRPPAWKRLGPPEKFTFEFRLQCTAESATSLKALIPQPQSDETAQVEIVQAPPSHLRVTSWNSPDGVNRWWNWTHELAGQRNVEFIYHVEVATRSIAVDLAATPDFGRRNKYVLSPSDRKRYLRLTTHTGKDWVELPRVAADIEKAAASEGNSARTARAIYDAVRSRLDYDAKEDFSGAQSAWNRRAGQCCDYVALFVAVCRQLQIPARAVAGYYFQEDRWRMHVWAEFHLDGFGWTPCDPTMGDAGPDAAEKFFAATDGRRFAVTRDLDLPISLGPGADASLVQEYLMRYRGRSKPKIGCHVTGRRLDRLSNATGEEKRP